MTVGVLFLTDWDNIQDFIYLFIDTFFYVVDVIS